MTTGTQKMSLAQLKKLHEAFALIGETLTVFIEEGYEGKVYRDDISVVVTSVTVTNSGLILNIDPPINQGTIVAISTAEDKSICLSYSFSSDKRSL